MTVDSNRIHRALYYLTLFLIPTQLGYHFWPDWAMVLGRRIDYLSPTIYLTDILICMMIGFWILHLGNLFKRVVTGHVKKRNGVFFVAAAAVSFAVINILFSVSVAVSLLKWFRILEISLFTLYIIKSRPDIILSVRILAFTAVLSVFLGVTQMFTGQSVGGIFRLAGERSFTQSTPNIAKTIICFGGSYGCREILRPYAAFPHPNVLAGFLSVVLFLYLMNIKRPVQHTTAVGLLQLRNTVAGLEPRIVVLVLCTGIVLTFSRSAWLACCAGVVLYVLKARNVRQLGSRTASRSVHHLRNMYIGGAAAVILGVAGLLLGYRDFVIQGQSVTERVDLIRAATDIWTRYPLTGSGLGASIILTPGVLPVRETYVLQPVHSIYILLFTEAGIMGFGIAFSALYIYLKRLRGNDIVLGIPFFMLLGIGTVDHYVLTLPQGQMILAVAATFPFLAKHFPKQTAMVQSEK